MAEQATLALEYHGKETTAGHWRKNQELVDALAYIDPLTPDVKQQVDKLIEEEMRRSKLRPQDYLNKLPPMPPAKFEGHPLLQKEYDRCDCCCCCCCCTRGVAQVQGLLMRCLACYYLCYFC